MRVLGRNARMSRHHKRHQTAEINLVSMIDMFTILVFFLLVHGGFVRLAILELNLPSSQSDPGSTPPEFQLEVTVRESKIEIGDRTKGLLTTIEKSGERYDLAGLSAYLADVKARFPEKSDATLLLEPDIAYEVVIAVMDRMRVAQNLDPGADRFLRTELFPDISVGDAPMKN